MQYRVGKCRSCGATFKVPASFQGDKAKCKACDKGVVDVGPVQGGDASGAAAPKPAAKPAPAKKAPTKSPAPVKAAAAESEELEEHVPSGKKRSGPSMMEKLRAERAAAEAAAAKPVPAKKPGAGKARTATAAKTPAGRAKPGGARRPAVRAGAVAGAAKTTRRAGARSGAGSRRGDDDEEGEGGGRRGRRAPEKKSPAPLIGGIVVLAAAGFGVWKFVLSEDDKPVQASDEQAASGENPADDTAETPLTDETTGVEDPGSDAATGLEDPGADEATADDPADDAAAPTEPGAPDLGPDLTDTAAYPRFGPPEGTSEEDWAKAQEYIETFLDPGAGAKGNRALDKAIEMQKAGFAAIVNKMLDLDYTTVQGYRDGDNLQRALEKIANGKNAGWKYTTEEADVRFNRKAVALLWKVWNRSKDDEAYWLSYTKQDKKAEDDAVEEALSDDDLDDLDDLDDF